MASNIVFDGTKGISLPSFTTTEKNAIVSPATGATVFDTTQNRQNVYAGGAWNAGLNSGTAVASTSGTSIDFTGIPSWVKRITVMLNDVSFNGSSSVCTVRIGAGSLSTSGYVGGSLGFATTPGIAYNNVTTGFGSFNVTSASGSLVGTIVIENTTGNTWCATGQLIRTTDNAGLMANGYIALSGTLDRVSVVATTNSFDAGSINILYE